MQLKKVLYHIVEDAVIICEVFIRSAAKNADKTFKFNYETTKLP
uniref:Uncharacterized protein n=1 Tax=Ignisphaera aggregans TaxID=334771 RepID=A0A7C4JME7_9CREN